MPATTDVTVRRGRLLWRGELRPSPLSRTYSVQLVYPGGDRTPAVTVVRPRLRSKDLTKLPHVYPGDELCLCYPWQWGAGQLIARTIVPWSAEWLLHFEDLRGDRTLARWRHRAGGAGVTSARRGSISDEATLRLWVQAGGRCEYRGCNAYLLEDELTTYTLNLAERAHIVGATDAPGSPRGDFPLATNRRDDASNLLLLCRQHHRIIDRLIVEHTVDELHRMKSEHEDRVRLLTGLQDDASTVVVRAIGAIRGAPVDVPRTAVLEALRADRRFPRYPLALAGEDIEINLRQLGDPDGMEDWLAGERIIARQLARIRDAQTSIHHLSVFALARIPLLVALGFHLDDKIPATIYSRRRQGAGDGALGFDPDLRRADQLRRSPLERSHWRKLRCIGSLGDRTHRHGRNRLLRSQHGLRTGACGRAAWTRATKREVGPRALRQRVQPLSWPCRGRTHRL